jgi:hypothetical protein
MQVTFSQRQRRIAETSFLCRRLLTEYRKDGNTGGALNAKADELERGVNGIASTKKTLHFNHSTPWLGTPVVYNETFNHFNGVLNIHKALKSGQPLREFRHGIPGMHANGAT